MKANVCSTKPMALRLVLFCLIMLCTGSLTGCDGWDMDSYWRSEKYVLIAVDTKGQMALAFDIGGGGAVGLVDATVFSIGADEHYIVVKQHPATDKFGNFDRRITNYFVVDRTSSSSTADRQKGVRGPLSEADFKKLDATLSLPKFTTTFSDLE